MINAREYLVALLTALDASARCLERPNCRGWIGDWQITGKHGHAMTDDTVYLLYAQATPRRWTSIKHALAFCKLTQDGDDEAFFALIGVPLRRRLLGMLSASGNAVT
jgi:hypothetical protein